MAWLAECRLLSANQAALAPAAAGAAGAAIDWFECRAQQFSTIALSESLDCAGGMECTSEMSAASW